jgi:hypothetical protein
MSSDFVSIQHTLLPDISLLRPGTYERKPFGQQAPSGRASPRTYRARVRSFAADAPGRPLELCLWRGSSVPNNAYRFKASARSVTAPTMRTPM